MEQPLLLRMNDAARLCSVSRAKLYKMVRQGQVPVVKFGKSLRVPYEGLKRAIESNTGFDKSLIAGGRKHLSAREGAPARRIQKHRDVSKSIASE